MSRERLLYKERIKMGKIGLKGCGLFRPSFKQNLKFDCPKLYPIMVKHEKQNQLLVGWT